MARAVFREVTCCLRQGFDEIHLLECTCGLRLQVSHRSFWSNALVGTSFAHRYGTVSHHFCDGGIFRRLGSRCIFSWQMTLPKMQHRNFVVYKHSIKTINSLPFWYDKHTVVPRSHFPRNTKKKELLGLVQQVVFWTNPPTQHCHVEVNWIEDSTSFWACVTRNEDLVQGDFLIFFRLWLLNHLGNLRNLIPSP